MSRTISTLALVAVLAGLGGYIYFVDNRRPPAGAGEPRDTAFTVTADEIEELRIAIADSAASTIRRGDNGWQLVDPVEADADSSELNTMASTLAQLQVQRVVEESASDLAVYGLEAPRLEVGFKRKGQDTYERLLIGDRTPTGGDVYVKRPDEPRVFLVSSFVDDTFRRTTFDLRDKMLLRFGRDSVTGLEITNASGTMRFERKGANWMFVRPRSMRADFGTLESTITSLSATLMQKFVDDGPTPAELAQYGLTRPSASASIILGDTRLTLELGRTDNAETYARVSNRPAVVMVAPTIVSDVNRPLSGFRRREVFDLRQFSASRLEVTRGGETLVLVKGVEDGADIWKDGDRTVAADAVDRLLARLSNVRTQEFEDRIDPALSSPEVVITASFGENKDENLTETVRLARSGSANVASRPDEPGMFRLEGSPIDDILTGLDALK